MLSVLLLWINNVTDNYNVEMFEKIIALWKTLEGELIVMVEKARRRMV